MLSKISVYALQTDLPIQIASIEKLVSFVLEEELRPGREVGIYLIGEKESAKLHKRFFNDPSPTDCLSFPLDEEFLGEIFICPKMALNYAPNSPYLETSLYIIHAILHLLGYDDIDREERKKMSRRQRSLLTLAKKRQCLLHTSC